MFLSVVIPAYNEEKRLPDTLQKVRNYLNQKNITYEVIVVNDGSKDRMAQTIEPFINREDNLRLIDNKVNKGKGAVVKQGMLEAKGEWRLFMDADNSTDISELQKLLKFANPKHEIPASPAGRRNPKPVSLSASRGGQIQNSESQIENLSYDIIIGSRYLDKSSIKIKQPLLRRIMSRAGNLLIRILLGIKSVDTQCGFKLFSAKAAQEIFPLQTIERWGFDMEILAIAIRKGYKIKEVPVDWYDAEGSQVKKSAALKTLKELFLIKRNLMRGKYR